MRRLASLLFLVTATGGCATDPVTDLAPDSGDAELSWPCKSTTRWTGSQKETYQFYEWDAHHNLTRKNDNGDELFTWTFDPSGQIAINEEHGRRDGSDYIRDTIRRDVVDGRVLAEHRTIGVQSYLTTYRYDRGQLFEKHTIGGYLDDMGNFDLVTTDVLTDVWFQDDTRFETDEVLSGDVSGTGSRSWKGEPWTQWRVRTTGDQQLVTRTLDDQGREIHRDVRVSESGASEVLIPSQTVDIERDMNGAPVREVWSDHLVRPTYAAPLGDRTVTYQTECP